MGIKRINILLTLLIVLLILSVCAFLLLPRRGGWSSDQAGTAYYRNGHTVTGWQDIDGSRYYFGADGLLRTGWQDIDGSRYYLDAGGILQTGWLNLDGAQYYLGADGAMRTGIAEIEGKAYLFSQQGHLAHGWTTIGEKRYYADEQGCPLSGWNNIGDKLYYFDETSVSATGWNQIGNFMHYFHADGSAAQGALTVDGVTQHFASNGQLLYLVNPWHLLPEDYSVELVSLNDTCQIAAIAYRDYLDMIADCRAAGMEPAVCSAYRTQEYQEKLYRNRIKRYLDDGYSEEEATELAGKSVAVPGTSEHQLGLALDIVDNRNWHLDETQADMPTQIWLMENSWRYGWILRYPSEKSHITGIIYEPWHYRYVGKTVAREIHELNVCLEEYLEMLTTSVG